MGPARGTNFGDNKTQNLKMWSTSEFDFSLLGVDIDLKSSTTVRIWLVLSGKNTKNLETAPSFCNFKKYLFLLQILWATGTHLPTARDPLSNHGFVRNIR